MEKVSIVKCSSYKNEEIRKALEESLKNINFKFKENMKVLIKPNLLSPAKPEKAITTHPVIIEELCKILKKYNAKIYIGDSSGSDTNLAFKLSGIGKLRKYGKIINFEGQDKIFFDLGYKNKIPLPKILFQVDLIINVAKLKTHEFTQVTLCVKNLYGCISGRLKGTYHRLFPRVKDFSLFLSKIEKTIKPQLNIIDGILGMEENGPGASGIPIQSKILIISRSAGATDIIASEIMGFNPKTIYTNQFSGIKRKNIETIGNGKNILMKFKKPDTNVKSFLSPLYKLVPRSKVGFHKEKCKLCHLCEGKCPVKAIKIINFPECNHKKCIKCLCCIEVCPNEAVYLKENKIIALLKKLKRKIEK